MPIFVSIGIEVSLRAKNKTFIRPFRKNRQQQDLSNNLIHIKTKIRHYKTLQYLRGHPVIRRGSAPTSYDRYTNMKFDIIMKCVFFFYALDVLLFKVGFEINIVTNTMQNKKTNNKLQTYHFFIRIIIFKTEDCSFPYFLLNCQLLLVLFGCQGGTPEVLASTCDLGDRRQAPTRTLLYSTGPLPFETSPGNNTII